MRVLLINDHGRFYGGAEMQVLTLRDVLLDLGHDVRLFSSNAEMLPGFTQEADVTCHGRTDIAQVALQTVNPSAWHALRRELREFPPDVVHIRSFLWQLSPLILPLLKTVPVLHVAPTYKEICPNGLKLRPGRVVCTAPAGPVCWRDGCVSVKTYASARLQMALLARWRNAIDVTAALSERAATAFRASGWQDVEVLHNPVDYRPAFAAPADVPTLAYAGRLAPEKGVDLLIEAFIEASRSVPGARLLIAGTGPCEAKLRAQGEKANIQFLGHLPAGELDAALAPAWLQAIPSLWDEPFGNVTLEAMMRGTAVIGSDRGATPEIVGDGAAGRIVPSRDVSAWRDALVNLLSDRTLCVEMGRRGRERATTVFSRKAYTAKVLSLYRKARQNYLVSNGLSESSPNQLERQQ